MQLAREKCRAKIRLTLQTAQGIAGGTIAGLLISLAIVCRNAIGLRTVYDFIVVFVIVCIVGALLILARWALFCSLEERRLNRECPNTK